MKTLIEFSNEGNEITLDNIRSKRAHINGEWQSFEYTLTDEDKESISNLLGGINKTKSTVYNKLGSLSTIPSHWSFARISFCKHSKRWVYCAGQDYPYELSIIRNWFKKL